MTNLPDLPYAVIGATGQQGGATARALLAAGAGVRALVRDPGAATARGLAAEGATLARADIENPASLRAAFAGVAGVFAVTTPSTGVEAETQHGVDIADAAEAAGVPHLVFSSVGGADRKTGIPHFESKRRVEEHLESLELPTTIIRPVFFMDNFARFAAPPEEDGMLVVRLPLPAGIPLQMVAVADIGVVATSALLDPSRVPGGAVEIAGVELTGEEIAETYAKVTGKPARYQALPLSVLDGDGDQRTMFAWLAEPPAYRADFSLTRALAPGVRDFATWLAERS
jgi:uncharacterized protein YbjT (DUF2867 family)